MCAILTSLSFFRIKTTRTGQALQLVESYRNQEGKPRQRIVVSLANLEVPERHRIAPEWPDKMAAWLDDPVSEHAMPDWLGRSSLADLLGDELRCKADDIFYRTGDRLLGNHERIEAHLRARQARLFNLERTILLCMT